jgi:hypothetical protein
LSLWLDEMETDPRTGQQKRWSIWSAPVDITDKDIVVGEGRQIVFVDPATIDRLDVGRSARPLLRRFLMSERYAELCVSDVRLDVNGGSRRAPDRRG